MISAYSVEVCLPGFSDCTSFELLCIPLCTCVISYWSHRCSCDRLQHIDILCFNPFSIEGMIGYGMAKAAVHQLTKSLAQANSGLPQGATVLSILP